MIRFFKSLRVINLRLLLSRDGLAGKTEFFERVMEMPLDKWSRAERWGGRMVLRFWQWRLKRQIGKKPVCKILPESPWPAPPPLPRENGMMDEETLWNFLMLNNHAPHIVLRTRISVDGQRDRWPWEITERERKIVVSSLQAITDVMLIRLGEVQFLGMPWGDFGLGEG